VTSHDITLSHQNVSMGGRPGFTDLLPAYHLSILQYRHKKVQ